MINAEKPFDIKKRCYQFSRVLLQFINEAKYDRIHFSIFDQLLRSGTSIGANVVEGGVGTTKKDVINFYHIALKSANETKYWLCLIRDSFDCNKEGISSLINEADELSKIIASSIIKMKSS